MPTGELNRTRYYMTMREYFTNYRWNRVLDLRTVALAHRQVWLTWRKLGNEAWGETTYVCRTADKPQLGLGVQRPDGQA